MRLQALEVKALLDLSRIALPSSPYMGAKAFIQTNPETVENFVKAMIEASTVMRAQKEKGRAVLSETHQDGQATRRNGI